MRAWVVCSILAAMLLCRASAKGLRYIKRRRWQQSFPLNARHTPATIIIIAGLPERSPPHRQGAGLRTLLPAPRDVYAAEVTNKSPGAMAVNVTFVKYSGETRVESKSLGVDKTWKVGPYDYSQGPTTFRYVVHAVSVADEAGNTAKLEEPFPGVLGVTPTLHYDLAQENGVIKIATSLPDN
jgi:hypothetical protein